MADEKHQTYQQVEEEREYLLFSILTTDLVAMMQSIHPRSV